MLTNNEEEQCRIFKQMLNAFYHNNTELVEENKQNVIELHSVKIEPKIIYNSFSKTLKVEFKIGNKQMYKLKDLPSFYDRMLKKESFHYGAKLEFIHDEQAFEEKSLPLLHYIFKYAEIIKYTNESMKQYNHYGRSMENNFITISNSGMDEFFDIMKGNKIEFQTETSNESVYFQEEEPSIRFDVKKEDADNYIIMPHKFEVYEYEIIEGKKYIYFLYQNVLYRCDEKFKETILKLLKVFRNNYSSQVKFHNNDLKSLFSIVYPKMKKYINLNYLDEQDVNQYVPKELFVKVFLDVTKENYITAEVKFVYGDMEFNPFEQEQVTIPRDITKENEVLGIFLKTGFMLDRAKSGLILVNEDKIYSFLSSEIELYMQQFEVLATSNFKQKEIRKPKLENLGVRIENNLLYIDFSKVDFDITELKEIMNKYQLKKKYHRLKDGSFLELEESDTLHFIESITDAIDIGYEEIQKGELHMPLYRSMYLERLLKNVNSSGIEKNAKYKSFIKNIDKKEIDYRIDIPKGLCANLRNYQKDGFKWLSLLDSYQLGGILADDMGLRKNSSNVGCYFIIHRKYRKTKTKYCCLSKFSCT